MITATIDKSKIKDFNAFKGVEWREATPEEAERVTNVIASIRADIKRKDANND